MSTILSTRLQTLLCHFSSRCSSFLSCKTRTKQLSGRRMWQDNHWLVHWLVDNIKWHCDVMLWAGDVRLQYFYRLVLFCNELLSRLLVAGISISMDGAPVHCCVLSGCHEQEGRAQLWRHARKRTLTCNDMRQINKSTRRGSVTSCHYADGFQGESFGMIKDLLKKYMLKIWNKWKLTVGSRECCAVSQPFNSERRIYSSWVQTECIWSEKENKACEFCQPVFINASPKRNNN